jgi:23S rRNA (pseudouridine1915-N3)-methyltransferase
MHIRIINNGKHNDDFKLLIDDYLSRLNRSIKTDWLQMSPSGKPEVIARKQESDDIRAKIKDSDVVWLLDETGQQITSVELASRINTMQYQSVQELVIIVGGAYGVDADLKARADFVWSLSKLVFPHRLAQLILVEQLYRACEINRGSNCHHI